VKALIALAAIVALSQPLAALAEDNQATPSSQSATMATTETTAIVSKPSQNRQISTFVVPKALTANQVNAQWEAEYDKLFNVTPGFHSP